MASTNYSIYAIPAYFILSMLPHYYATSIIQAANNGHRNNSNPHSLGWHEKIQKSIPAKTFGRYERAKRAHENGMESMALFCASIILGNMAGQPAIGLNVNAGLFLAFRVIYTVAYIYTESEKYSSMRSVIWGLATGICLWQIYRSGQVFASRSGKWKIT
ncbi:hypothetical protein MMC29_005624 [Sticta canariensis]|nr:hypothetical protein [Sticta canariensis]